MDLTISNRVWADSGLSTSEKMVLLALDHLSEIDPDGFSWYGYEKLAEITGINLESKYLTKLINKLQEKGLILIWRQHGRKGGRGYTHIYWPIIGRTDDQILETIMRRFVATQEEARAIISQDGPIYDDLIKRNRVSGKTLEDTKAIKKGVTKTPIGIKGYPDYTQSDDIGVPETPISEDDAKKGVLGTPRLLESSSLESYPNKESLQDSSPYGEGGKPPIEIIEPELELPLEQVEESPPDSSPPIEEPENPAKHPAIQAYRSVANRYPDKATWEMITTMVGRDPPNVAFWGNVVRDYIACGWNKTNVKTMLEHYERRELPKQTKNGATKNGYHSPSEDHPRPNPARERTGSPTTAEQLTAAWERKSRGGRDPT